MRTPTLALRLIAARKSEADAAESRRKARRQAQKDGYQLSQNTLAAADWFILVTSLKAAEFSPMTCWRCIAYDGGWNLASSG